MSEQPDRGPAPDQATGASAGPRRVPVSTYRLQITADFDLFAAAELVPYLRDLGVDWVYLSPILQAEEGSDHGYDVLRHDRIDPARGGAEGLAALSAAAHDAGMGVLVDIVPNHVGVATPVEGTWWWDVLQHGRASEHAVAFDVDWAAGGGRLLLPVVGDDDLLAPGGIDHLSVDTSGAEPVLAYHDNRFPVAPGTAAPGDDPQDVHDRQAYELVGWRRADAELNYRRFFAVNTLAAIRVEDPEVFAESHVEIRRWFTPQDDGRTLVDGLRVDHPDGLRFPGAYLDDLARLTDHAYVLVEKILEPGEALPTTWATAGTTGYDALAHVDRVLTDPAGQAPLDALEARLRGHEVDWATLVHDRKREVADGILNAEVNRITRELVRELDPGDDPGASGEPGDGAAEPRAGASGVPEASRIADAVAEALACFEVYRSYLPLGRHYLDEAVAEARRRRPELGEVLDMIAPVLADPWTAPARRFQQTSGMVMAKGVEDCAFYRYSRLTSLDEVGGDPSVFSMSVDDFHAAMTHRQSDWPDAMTCLSTHDTKRGEDTRARITTLAEIPEEWAGWLDELLAACPLPDRGFGSLLWQAVLGAWPAPGPDGQPPADLRERLHGYAEKAMREAGDHTTWTAPDEEYEQAVHAAVDAALDDPDVRRVLDTALERVVDAGWSNALAAKLVALAMPGVPDVYQGSELWEQSLVDPDNRRPVDFDLRSRMLASDDDVAAPHGLADPGAAKLLLVFATLRLRRDSPELFTAYAGVAARGEAAEHALAFDRGGVVAVVTRLPLGLADRGGWGDTALDLPDGSWTDLLTGRPTDGTLADLLATYPVALLVRTD